MLHRMIFGYCCTIIAFVLAALVEMQIERREISILWQIPQFFVLAIAEIFSYLSQLNFAYKEAPISMKPVMVAFMYLSIASGDFIVAIISGISFFKTQVYEYILFASLMIFDVIILSLMTHKYNYTDHEMIKAFGEEEENSDNKDVR
jgi:dipeptide/tripeptide permease